MNEMVKIMSEDQIDRSLSRLAHEIIEKNNNLKQVALVGIKRRGIYLAQRLADKLAIFAHIHVPVETIDISLYRDDLTQIANEPRTEACHFNIDVKEYNLVIVDDVLFTGRTVRAAIDAIFDMGRPITIQLAILIDRGHRELPIRPDYVGKNIPTSRLEIVHVELAEIDGFNQVYVTKMHKKSTHEVR